MVPGAGAGHGRRAPGAGRDRGSRHLGRSGAGRDDRYPPGHQARRDRFPEKPRPVLLRMGSGSAGGAPSARAATLGVVRWGRAAIGVIPVAHIPGPAADERAMNVSALHEPPFAAGNSRPPSATPLAAGPPATDPTSAPATSHDSEPPATEPVEHTDH